MLLYSGNDVYQQKAKTIKNVLLKRHKKQEKTRNFAKILQFCKSEMADDNQETPDQSHLLDDTTIPLVDIASSVTSTEEEVIFEPEKEKICENVEVVQSSADHSPAMVMTLRSREEEEEEVFDLSSDEEEEHPVISGIFQTHIQPKLTTNTSQKWLNETMGGLNVLSKAIKKGKVGRISRSPSPKKNLSGESFRPLTCATP